MSEETRTNALQKMEKFRVKIGYPDQWVDYTTLSVSKDSHVGNMLASARFDSARDLARINRPTDRERWFMCPQRINAYYHPMLNEIVFPAAILEAPFFDREADTAMASAPKTPSTSTPTARRLPSAGAPPRTRAVSPITA